LNAGNDWFPRIAVALDQRSELQFTAHTAEKPSDDSLDASYLQQ